MGWHAARKLRRAVDALSAVLAVELVTAARSLDLRCATATPPLAPAAATGAVVALLRGAGVAGPGPDHHLAPDLETATALVRSGAVLDAAGLDAAGLPAD